VKRILLLVFIAITFAGCATESDPDRLSWEDTKEQVKSAFGKDSSDMAQALGPTQGQDEDQYRASQNL